MRKRVLIGLVLINVILGAAVVVGPLRAQIFPRAGLLDCCQGSTCCFNCCWFVNDCDFSGDCEEF